ncbi:MAG: FlgD immunoglobulin-like domain containing protein, partial [Candidatus Hodarchaeota archaeon]
PGTSDNVQLIISFPDSAEDYYGTELILSTNSPKYGETIIPIYLGDIKGDIKTDMANDNKIPTRFDLEQNFPNPFNSQTQIRFSLPSPSKVKLMVINLLGQNTKTLYSAELNAGIHTLYWDGKNNEGVDISSGIYLINLEAGKWNKIIKALLLR